MDQANPNMHEQDLASGENITHGPNSAGGDDCGSNGTGETQRIDSKDNREEEKNLDKEDKNSSNKVEEDKKRPYKALEEINNQKTHNLYCPKCTCNITKTAQLFEIGKEPYPYNKQPFVLWVPLVFPFNFKLSSIPSLPWFSHNPTIPIEPHEIVIFPDKKPPPRVVNETPKKQEKHVLDCWPWLSPISLRFLLIMVVLLLSATLLWPSPHLNTNGSSTVTISLLLLAILTLSWPKSVVTNLHLPQNQDGEAQVSTNNIPAEDGIVPYITDHNDEDSKKTPEDGPKNAEKDTAISKWISKILPSNQTPGPSENPGLSTPDKTVDTSVTKETVISPAPTLVRIPDVLWTHIVVPVQNLIPRELDILKSIVYGGLIESITSLGVVSSAAASGASTLNVLALGLANLFSGLFLIIHSLYGLVTSQPRFQNANIDPMINVVEEDPYQNLLGNRRKVKLHCFVVVVSFIFFGVIPPLFYGLSFKRTDKGHYKAAVVLAASLVCVISLSFAKAYAFRMRKLNTVAEYTGMAIGASALSFIGSQIVADMFEKYGFHELASDYRKG